MSSAQYLLRRIGAVPRTLGTPTGLMALVGAVCLLGALFTDGWASGAFAVIAVVAWFVAFLLLSDRLRTVNARVGATPQQREESKPDAEDPHVDRSRSLKDRRLESARAELAASATSWDTSTITPEGAVPADLLGLPLVTVVVSCHNEASYLLPCLTSVLEQTYDNLECIVVDDASTDESLRLAWELAQTDPRLRVVRHTRNSGLSAARNTGLRLAKGSLISFLDADDLLMPPSIEDRVDRMRTHALDPLVVGVFCGATQSPEDATLDDYQQAHGWTGQPADFVLTGDQCPFNVHAALVRTDVVRGAAGFSESMRFGAEDWDLWYRLMRNGYRFEPSSLRSVVYRQKQRSMRRRLATEHLREAERLTDASYDAVDPTVIFQPEPVIFTGGRESYLASISLTRRAIQGAARALIAGDVKAAEELLAQARPVHPTVLARHIDVETAMVDGFSSYLGISRKEFRDVEASIAPVFARMRSLVASSLRVAPESMPVTDHRVDIALLPQTASQLEGMLTLASSAPGSVCVIDCSATAGDQGVADHFHGAGRPELLFSHNEAVLGGLVADTVVIAYPSDEAIDELAGLLADRGATVLEWRTDLDSVLRLPEVPIRTTPSAPVDSDHLRMWLSGTRALAPGTPPRRRDGHEVRAFIDAADAWTVEEYPDTRFDAEDIARFHDRHVGESVIIIGNGPSLNDLDLSLMKGTATIGVNGIFYAEDRLPEPLSYYVVEDTMVVRDNLDRIRDYRAGHRFFPSIYREMIGEREDTSFFMMNRGFYASTSPAFCVPRFSTDPTQRVYAGQSVTIMNLQLAYYMGFSEVVLIGMDFTYSVPESSKVEGVHITSMGDDPNHFHPEYFGKGKVWKDPKLDRVLANYALAKQMYEADGRRIVNATPGGNLDLFDRVNFEELLRP